MQIKYTQHKKIILLFIAVILSSILSSCGRSRELDYYSNEANYIVATGTLVHVAYSSDLDALYLGFSELNPDFDDITFKIVGKNLTIAQDNGIDDKIQLGDQLTFISAPLYLGDGYVMPIVELSVQGETLLCFEEGVPNFLEWLKR